VIAEGEWNGVPPFELGYQTQPGDNNPATERTELRVAFGSRQLYVAVHAFDSDAAGVRARVTRRDDIGGDDSTTIYLDTYDDRRRAYVVSFNPLGIQSDGIYTEGVATALGREHEYQFNAVRYTINTFKRVTVTGRLQLGEAVHFDALKPQVGRNITSTLTVTVSPNASLNSEFLYLKNRLTEYGTSREQFDQDA
jgi:hypothetical protein